METVVEQASGNAVIRMDGRFDIKESLAFRNALKPLLAAADVVTITIDFEKVSFMDSSGLGLLLWLREQAQQAGKEVVLRSCSANLLKVLSIAQFHRIFRIE